MIKIALLLLMITSQIIAQIEVDVNLDMRHVVGGFDHFDRSKWMVIHSTQEENEWDGELDKLDYLINDLDVYFGRNTGMMTWQSGEVNEDILRPGYADTNHIKQLADTQKKQYANKTDRHAFEKGNVMMGSLQTPFYPNGCNATRKGWYFDTTNTQQTPFGTAVGEYIGMFLKYYFTDETGTAAYDRPKYFEVINEPIWPLVEKNMYGGGTIKDIFAMHKSVADQIHRIVPGVKVGGYTAAFPDLDKNGFGEWEERFKPFIRDVGDRMDFYSVHLYDFPLFRNTPQWRRGGRNEATFDMIEQYNMIKYGSIKPMIVSEYGAQTHNLNNSGWSSLRDWYKIESTNAQLLQFLQRPNVIVRAIPFMVPKALWAYNAETNQPYASRLMRKANEPESYTGDWVWTDFIKFFELWSEVKGIRVESYTKEVDLQVDCYVDGKNVYLILNNIDDQAHDFKINLLGATDNSIESVKVKRLFLNDKKDAQLDILNVADFDGTKTIKGNETIIVKYVYKNPVAINEKVIEDKVYASSYKQAINANTPVPFNFNKPFTLSNNGEAVLRIGIGRVQGKTKFPTNILINGNSVAVPNNYRGDLQINRESFFSVLEVPFPYRYLQPNNNNVSVVFSDGGGYVSSLAIQNFRFSRKVVRTGVVNDNITFNDKPISIIQSGEITESVTYTSTEPRDILLVLRDSVNNWIGADRKTVDAGSGTKELTISFDSLPQIGTGYRLTADIREQGGDWTTVIDKDDAYISIVAPTLIIVTPKNEDKLQVYPNPINDKFTIVVDTHDRASLQEKILLVNKNGVIISPLKIGENIRNGIAKGVYYIVTIVDGKSEVVKPVYFQ